MIVNRNWELRILNDIPRDIQVLNGLAVGDLDNDGHAEIVTGGKAGVFWYRPDTSELGEISSANTGCGLVLEDVDGDDLLEVVVSRSQSIAWLKPEGNLKDEWQMHIIVSDHPGRAHDILFADMDNDGERELVAVAAYSKTPGVYIYKPGKEVTQAWKKFEVSSGFFSDGMRVADLNGDGQLEIINGPYWYECPSKGPFSGRWKQHVYAPNFREMTRTAVTDIAGNGRPDIVIAEAEYMEGHMSWFENRLLEDPKNPWAEHEIDCPLYYAHSLEAWRSDNVVKVFMGEMEKGGWNAPYNFNAQIALYESIDNGGSWKKSLIQGQGTHEATVFDVDGDGELEIVGKECCQMDVLGQPKIQIWKYGKEPNPITRYSHEFIDRDKPETGTDILASDVDSDGLKDVLCCKWWYKTPTWERFQIPGINQVHFAYDIDGDGRDEIIAAKGVPGKTGYSALASDLCWLKPIDPIRGEWEEHPIGIGNGDWPHGICMAPILPKDRLALVIGYHSARKGDKPEIFEMPSDPAQSPWPQRVLADIEYGEEILAHDINGDGLLDLVAGPYWLENMGNGVFEPHQMVDGLRVARVCISDINTDGRPDVILGEEVLKRDDKSGLIWFSTLVWLENPKDLSVARWKMHKIDTLRCPHSIGTGDLDHDGQIEIVAGEHDPTKPYRNQCRLYAYKKADSKGLSWYRYTLDDRFEHHDGTKVVELIPGRPAIISHGWKDRKYVHLWMLR